MEIRIAGTVNDSIVDGNGFRFTIFTQGCPHHCKGCHNPQTHAFDGGNMVTEEELLEKIKANPLLDGVTFSGGDPLYLGSRLDLLELIKEIKEKFPTKTMWLYTGYLWEEIKDLELVSYLDVLVDGEFIYEQLDATLKWKGSANQRVIDVQKSLAQGEVVLHA